MTRTLPWIPLILSSLLLTGCPMGDCWGEATVTVTLDPSITWADGDSLVIVGEAQILEEDVTGTDADGIPETPDGPSPGEVVSLSADESTYTWVDESTVPYPYWYYAFVDADGSGTLDAGEAFGVAEGNPYDEGCDSFEVAITVDAIR